MVSHHLKPCLGNSKLGQRRKMRRHRSGPYSTFKMPRLRLRKMPRHRLRKMPEHRCGPCKSADTSGPSIMRGQRHDPCTTPKKDRREQQNARLQVPPAQDARVQDQSVQNAQLPWLLQGFGLRN